MREIDCEELIDWLRSEARDQVKLALLSAANEVVGMHLELAEFNELQARVAEEICSEDLLPSTVRLWMSGCARKGATRLPTYFRHAASTQYLPYVTTGSEAILIVLTLPADP